MVKFNRREFTRVLAGSGSIGLFGVATEAKPQNVSGTEPRQGSITDVQGVRVGHYSDPRRPTGCTAILFDSEVSAGVDYDGSAPGEQQALMLQPVSPLETIHGILLAGGAPMGLAAVPGMVKYLDEHHVGYD